MKKTILLLATILISSVASLSHAVVCTSEGRTADLTPSTACYSGGGNPHTSDIDTLFGGSPSWNLVSDISGIEGTNGTLGSNGFEVTLNAGSFWGASENIEGSWRISSEFWSLYNEAVISMHVGGNPRDNTDDFFAWSIPYGADAGTFEYHQRYGRGGGLSNLMLWGRNGNVPVAEPGNLALLTFGLLGLLVSRKLTHSK